MLLQCPADRHNYFYSEDYPVISWRTPSSSACLARRVDATNYPSTVFITRHSSSPAHIQVVAMLLTA
jgi:hypothetical protein